MAEYTLHCFAQSGNAYKAALMLAVSGADWEPRFEGGRCRAEADPFGGSQIGTMGRTRWRSALCLA